MCERQSEYVQNSVYESVCASHHSCQHNAWSCNVYFMLCWPAQHVEPQQPSNIHTAEVHLHIKGTRSAKSTWSEYLSLSVPLSLSPYVSCLSLAFQLSALPLPPSTPPFCSNPLLLKASLSFLSCSLSIPSLIALKKKSQSKERNKWSTVVADRLKPRC